jgi:hypothetical protein
MTGLWKVVFIVTISTILFAFFGLLSLLFGFGNVMEFTAWALLPVFFCAMGAMVGSAQGQAKR